MLFTVRARTATSESATLDTTISESAAATTKTSMVEEVLSVSEQTDSGNLNTMNLIDKVLKLEAKAKFQNDLECKKSLLISNLGLDNMDLMRDNHYPKIRYFLQQLDLGFVLDQKK